MDPGQRKVPECDADALGQLRLDALDRAVRLTRVGAFVIAVLDDQRCGRRTANVIDRFVELLEHRLLLG
jgi:hypothetical protein